MILVCMTLNAEIGFEQPSEVLCTWTAYNPRHYLADEDVQSEAAHTSLPAISAVHMQRNNNKIRSLFQVTLAVRAIANRITLFIAFTL